MQIYNDDCFSFLGNIEDKSVDLILTDPPYNTTSAKWDKQPVDWKTLWGEFNRIIRPEGMIVMTCAQPFTTHLISSNLEDYRYSWTWIKNRASNFTNAKRMPLRITEDIVVFGPGRRYFPQGLVKCNKVMKNSKSAGGEILREDISESKGKGSLRTPGGEYVQEFTNYPKNILNFDLPTDKTHPTAKPVPLFEYLINTYSLPGEVVLDPFGGSGTTGLAAINTQRSFILIEQDLKYVQIASKRVKDAQTKLQNSGSNPEG